MEEHLENRSSIESMSPMMHVRDLVLTSHNSLCIEVQVALQTKPLEEISGLFGVGRHDTCNLEARIPVR